MKIQLKQTVLILVGWLFFFQPAITSQTLLDTLDELVSSYHYDGPGYVVRIDKKGELFYEKAIGMANMDSGEELSIDHIFRIGSITKQFTAVAILQMIERGDIAIDDPIRRFMNDFPDPNNSITIEHLLTHTSGIKSYTGLASLTDDLGKKPLGLDLLIDSFKDEPVDFAPGEEFKYNNSGYVLLGKIIEVVSGMPYASYMKEEIFDPVQLDHTRYGDSDFSQPLRAQGYNVNREGNYYIDTPLHMDHPHAAGAIISTVADLSKWYYAVFGDRVISKEMREQAHIPYQLNNGDFTNYGYGWFVHDVEGEKIIRHGGGINGFSTSSVFLPEDEIFVAVFSNCARNPSDHLIKELVKACLGIPLKEMDRVEVPAPELVKYSGKYSFTNGEKLKIEVIDDRLIAAGYSQAKIELIPAAEHTFYMASNEYKVRFNVNRGGETKSLSLFSDEVEVAMKE